MSERDGPTGADHPEHDALTDPDTLPDPDARSHPDADIEPSGGRRTRPALIALGLVLLVASGVGVALLLGQGDRNERSAADGPEGTRTFEGLPRELPEALLPEGASDLEGTVARTGDSWSAAATYTVPGDLDAVARAVDAPLSEEGFVVRQRAYDDTTMQVIYDHEEGWVLNITYRDSDEGELIQVAAVLLGR